MTWEAEGDHIPVSGSLDRRLRLKFHDHSRLWSAELIRAFASTMRAGSLSPQCDISALHDASLVELDAENSNSAIIRGDD